MKILANLEFKSGSSRSLAAAVAAAVKGKTSADAKEAGWAVAKLAKEAGDENLTQEGFANFLGSNGGKIKKILKLAPVTEKKEETFEVTAADTKAMKSEQTFNGKVRALFAIGRNVAEVNKIPSASGVTSSYQRVKNVQKRMQAKG